MGRGGRRRGAGRKAGGKNRERTIRDVVESAVTAGGDPLAHMLRVMGDEKLPLEMRNAMAVQAAPYIHRKLAPLGEVALSGVSTVTKFEVEIVVPEGYDLQGGKLIDHAPLEAIGDVGIEDKDAAEALGDPVERRAV
jgi:hypothetical protein